MSFLRAEDVGEKLPPPTEARRRLRASIVYAVVGVAIALSAAAMLRYDSEAQQSPVWESLKRPTDKTGFRTVFAAAVSKLTLDPGNSYSDKFDFQKIEMPCYLIGNYRSSGALVKVIVLVVNLTQHVDGSHFSRSIDDWSRSGGAPLVPPKYPTVLRDETGMEKVKRALLNEAYERSLTSDIVEVSASHPKHKQVHFERELKSVARGDVAGFLIRNTGKLTPIDIDFDIVVSCKDGGDN